MNSSTRHRFRPQLEALEDRWCPSTAHGTAPPADPGTNAAIAATNNAAVQRPIADFVSQQGTTSVFNTELPGLPDNIGWSTATSVRDGHFALIDYSGKDAAFLLANYGINLGTTVSGTITERPLADGRVLVTVNLFTQNALAWASTYDPTNPPDVNSSSTPLLFGFRAQDLVANPSLTPALANSHLQVVFINSAPGAPLPDLVNAFILGNAAPGVELVSLSFRAHAAGAVHDPIGQQSDQQGTLVVSQTGVLARGGGHFVGDFGFAAEVVHILSRKDGGSNG